MCPSLQFVRPRCRYEQIKGRPGDQKEQFHTKIILHTNLTHKSWSDFGSDSPLFIVWCCLLLTTPRVQELFHFRSHNGNRCTFTAFKTQTRRNAFESYALQGLSIKSIYSTGYRLHFTLSHAISIQRKQ